MTTRWRFVELARTTSLNLLRIVRFLLIAKDSIGPNDHAFLIKPMLLNIYLHTVCYMWRRIKIIKRLSVITPKLTNPYLHLS